MTADSRDMVSLMTCLQCAYCGPVCPTLAEVGWVDVAGSIVVLVLSIPVALWAGAKLFRVGLLVYGKRPTLKEIWLILRRKG